MAAPTPLAMHDIWRVFRYLRFYPWHLTANILFNMLAVIANLFTFVMIVPFVEMLFGTAIMPTAPVSKINFGLPFYRSIITSRVWTY